MLGCPHGDLGPAPLLRPWHLEQGLAPNRRSIHVGRINQAAQAHGALRGTRLRGLPAPCGAVTRSQGKTPRIDQLSELHAYDLLEIKTDKHVSLKDSHLIS